jgi:aspartyl-tRNA(Asn)/glutamyl-tRNA(Gln) amidotransferase subunit A
VTIAEAGRLLRLREISCAELAERALRKAEETRELNAFITLTADAARERARELDADLERGIDRGPLHGIPVAYKDLFFTKGVRTTNGSKLFASFVPDYDATVVSKLESAGAVSVGKLNMHELAYGITSNNPHYGPVRNPHDPERIPGGSSGGSAVAVATGAAFCALGSDTGGSIRIPAAFCGVVGLKPTFGRVSRHGCFPLGFSLDHMGPLTRSVDDAALVLEAIAGPDGYDTTVVRRPAETFRPPAEPSLRGIRVGVAESFYNKPVDPEMSAAFARAVQLAESMGGTPIPVRPPDPEALIAVARAILLAESVAALAEHLHRRDEFGADVLALMDQGRQLPGFEYVNAQRIRHRIMAEYRTMFAEIDVLLTPTIPIPAPRIGQSTVKLDGREEDTRLLTTRFVRGINALGLPALSIPCGTTGAGLPLGLQIVGRAWSEKLVLQAGAALMSALGATPATTQ